MVGEANRRKLSFRNVSNVVVQLLHTIKPYSVPAPFSHLATTGGGFSSENAGGFQDNKTRQVSHVAVNSLTQLFFAQLSNKEAQKKLFIFFFLFSNKQLVTSQLKNFFILIFSLKKVLCKFRFS
jgi:hypothetical protein